MEDSAKDIIEVLVDNIHCSPSSTRTLMFPPEASLPELGTS